MNDALELCVTLDVTFKGATGVLVTPRRHNRLPGGEKESGL